MSSIDGSDRLEVGGNIFELIEFSLDRVLPTGEVREGRYGVNVAKVREVVRMPTINPLASSIKGVAGVFELRGIPIPAINLAVALGDQEAKVKPEQQIIVTEFSHKRAGFIVKTTKRIRRIAWENVLPPTSDKNACINGMTLVERNDFLFILDLEKILYDIETLGGFHTSSPAFPMGVESHESGSAHSTHQLFNGQQILLVDDSSFVLANTKNMLEKAGFKVTTASDGQKAQNILMEMLKHNDMSINAIVTDVEMPKMDGLTFTKWVKSNADLNQIPVILHTSLSGQANQEAGEAVGANGYTIKNDFRSLLSMLSDCTGAQIDKKLFSA